VAICGLFAGLESTSVGIELSGRLVVLGSGRFGLLGGGGLGVLLLPLVVREPVVVSGVRSVLVVGTVDARVVALPPIQWVFVVVWQRPALVVTGELFFLNCQTLAASQMFTICGKPTLLLGRGLLKPRNVVGASTVVPQVVIVAGFLPAGLSGLEVGEVVLLSPLVLGAEDLAPDSLL